ncbi:MAG: sulfotransferase [Phycisphaerales bacterium]
MNESTAPLVHVGLHRTGTTWLQRGLFAANGPGFHPALSLDEAIDLLVRPHPLAWHPDSARARAKAGIEAARAHGRVPVVSCEELSGNPHAGNRTAVATLDRIAEVLPEARVLLVLRRQPDLILSNHRQFVARGGTRSLAAYLSPDPAWFRMPRLAPEPFEFDRLASACIDRFGKDRVLVACHEQLVEDPVVFMRRIAEFAGASITEAALRSLPSERVNASPSGLRASIQRRTNRWLLRDDVNPDAPFTSWRFRSLLARIDQRLLRHLSGPIERRDRRRVEAWCRGRFAESNARLAAMTGLELRRYGYELPAMAEGAGDGLAAAAPRRAF